MDFLRIDSPPQFQQNNASFVLSVGLLSSVPFRSRQAPSKRFVLSFHSHADFRFHESLFILPKYPVDRELSGSPYRFP